MSFESLYDVKSERFRLFILGCFGHRDEQVSPHAAHISSQTSFCLNRFKGKTRDAGRQKKGLTFWA